MSSKEASWETVGPPVPMEQSDSLVLTRLVREAFSPLQYLIRQYFPSYSCRSLYKEFSISLCAFVIWLSFPVWGFLLLSLWAFSNCPNLFLFLMDLTCVPVLMPFPSHFNSLHSLFCKWSYFFMVSIPSFHWRFSSFSIFFWYVYIYNYLKGVPFGGL